MDNYLLNEPRTVLTMKVIIINYLIIENIHCTGYFDYKNSRQYHFVDVGLFCDIKRDILK